MSLNAWEQQALDSIKDRLAGSDPELAALLSAFTRMASGEEMPGRDKVPAGSRRAFQRLRRARWRSGVRRMGRRLGIQRAAVLLWLLTTAAVIAVALALNAGSDHSTCAEVAAIICVDPAPGHSSGSPSHHTATGQAPQQPAVRIQQANPKVPLGTVGPGAVAASPSAVSRLPGRPGEDAIAALSAGQESHAMTTQQLEDHPSACRGREDLSVTPDRTRVFSLCRDGAGRVTIRVRHRLITPGSAAQAARTGADDGGV